MLPPSTKRIVVLDAASPLGYYAAEALLQLETLSKDIAVVAVARQAPPSDNAAAYILSMLTDVVAEASEQGRTASVVFVNDRKRLQLDPASDVVVYATKDFDTAAFASVLPALGSKAAPPMVLCTCEDSHVAALSTMSGPLSGCRVVHVRTPFLSPPTTCRLRKGRCMPELVSPVENFALGVALGVTRFFPVNASQPADVIPVDYALAAGLSALGLCYNGKFPTSPRNPNHITLNIVGENHYTLCWGMIGEYVLDYYGRFTAEIKRRIPGDTLDSDPTLAFNAHFPDLWNYGLSLTTPVEMYRQYSARLTKRHLARYPHSATAERMKGAMKTMDTSLDTAIRFSPSKRSQFDSGTYRMLLRLVSQGRGSLDLFLAADIHSVKWENYVKGVAVRVLHYLSSSVLNHHEPLHLPFPSPVWVNDFEYQGENRAPEPNLPLRRVFDDVHMVLRAGQQPNGRPFPLAPGGTTRTYMGILAQPHVQQLITRLADEQFLSRDNVEARAMKILRQVGDNVNHQNARTLAFVLRKVFKTVYTRVSVNDGAYDTLHRVFHTPRTAVILMPTHRSYMDFIMMSYMLLVMGFPLPHICAGEDFLRLGAVSDLLRGSGAFFMRRSFKGDELYATLFKEYVKNLVRRGQSVEFFIEGTRSRTQKTLGPKLGFLKIITDAFLDPAQKEINDVLLLPISFSYEKVLEGNLYADELLGLPKPKETPMNLVRSASVLQHKFGSFNVSVGDPVSLADFAADPNQVPPGFERQPQRQPAASQPGALARAAAAVGVVSAPKTAAPAQPAAKPAPTSGSGKAQSFTPDNVLQRVAWRVTYELERHLVVTPTALTAAVVLHMFDHTQLREDGVPFAAVASRVEWLRSKVLSVGGNMNKEYASYDGPALLSYGVQLLSPHVSISALNRVFMATTSIATYMALTMYSNQLVHLFGDHGTVCVAANVLAPAQLDQQPAARPTESSTATGGTSGPAAVPASNASDPGNEEPAPIARFPVAKDALAKTTWEVRRLMWHELPDYQAANPVDHSHAFDKCLRSLAAQRSIDVGSTVTCSPNTYFTFVAQLVYPNIESYFVLHAALTVAANGARAPEAVLLNMAHKLALQLYDSKFVQYVQSSNKETLKNALGRAFEAKTARSQSEGRTKVVIVASGPVLNERLRDINALRNRPSSPEELQKCLAAAAELYAGMHKLQSKDEAVAKDKKAKL